MSLYDRFSPPSVIYDNPGCDSCEFRFLSLCVILFFCLNKCWRRSHAIFTITVEQRHKRDLGSKGDNPLIVDAPEDCFCAKLNLVDLDGLKHSKQTDLEGCGFNESD
jgi:hypothetical protein